MIRYSLLCDGEHAFDAWFSDSNCFDKQNKNNLIECPYCGSMDIRKQIMAPAITTKKIPSKNARLSHLISDIRQHIEKNYDYVGKDFADTVIAMHYGEITEKPVWGETTPEQADKLNEEGIAACTLPEPFAPLRAPDKNN